MSVKDSGNAGWARDPFRAAGGRRAYNAQRQFEAKVRRNEIAAFLDDRSISLLSRGTQATLAQHFQVSEATISRDVRGLLGARGGGRRCELCGARAVDAYAAEELEYAEAAFNGEVLTDEPGAHQPEKNGAVTGSALTPVTDSSTSWKRLMESEWKIPR